MSGLFARVEALTLRLILRAEASIRDRVAIFGLIGLLALLPGLAALPPTDRDESRFVQASRQMVETGDLIDIRFQDEARWQKPAGIYWLQAASATVFGGADAPIWAWRLPSALAILAAGLLAVWALAPVTGPRAAGLAGLMLATALLPVIEGHIAKTDAVLLATVLAVQGALARLLTGPPGRFGGMHLLFWAALGWGILVKGPIVLLPAGGVLLWLGVAERSAAPLLRLGPLPGLAILAAVVAPWAVAIALRSGGDFFETAVLGDLLGKVGEGAERHWGPPGYHLAVIWGTFWPWAPLMLFAAPAIWQRRRSPEVRFLLGWAVPGWLLFELVATKLPHYTLPLFPALAGLVALWLAQPQKGTPGPARMLLAAGLFALVGLVLALGAIVLLPMLEGRASIPGAALGVLALCTVALGARALIDRRVTAFLGLAAASALLLYPALFGFTVPRLATAFLSPRLAAAHAAFAACTDRPIVSVGYFEPSLVVAGGTQTRLLQPEAAAALLREEDGWLVFFEERRGRTLERFVADSGLPLQQLATISGFNYNRGARTSIFLIAREGDPRLAPCIAAGAGEDG